MTANPPGLLEKYFYFFMALLIAAVSGVWVQPDRGKGSSTLRRRVLLCFMDEPRAEL